MGFVVFFVEAPLAVFSGSLKSVKRFKVAKIREGWAFRV